MSFGEIKIGGRMKSSRIGSFFALLALSWAGSIPAQATPEHEVENAHAWATTASHAGTGKIILLVSVDWEGESLNAGNLAAMAQFRKEFPGLGILHFLNAAYFTKSNASPSSIQKRISAVLRPQDELGLHIHGWKSLFEASGVEFRSGPTAWGNEIGDCSDDCGHEVAINAYSTEELRKVVRYSLDTLDHFGFGRAQSFRAGAWLATRNVLDAISAEGLLVDSSAVPAKFLRSEIGDSPLYRWVASLWHGITPASQPTYLETASGRILEMPDNGALADYMGADEMAAELQVATNLLKQNPNRDVWIQIGFHQETATQYLPRVRQALHTILSTAQRDQLPLEFAKLPLHF